MANSQTEPTSTMSVEALRDRLFKGLEIEPDLLKTALRVTKSKLTAKVTKFGYYKGEVVSRVNVEDHSTQLAAADQIYSIAGVYSRERDKIDRSPTVALEVDPITGIVRVIVGTSVETSMKSFPTNAVDSVSVDSKDQLSLSFDSTRDAPSVCEIVDVEDKEEVETVKLKQAAPALVDDRPKDIPEYIWRMLNSK